MTLKEVAEMIEGIGVKYAYYMFPNGTKVAPPFICFYYDESNDVIADDTNYVKVQGLVIELYTKEKDFALEQKVEETLKANNIVYTRYENYIDTEKMFMQVYESEVIING